MILSLCDYDYAGEGIGKAFKFWISAIVVALVVIVLYSIESISCFIKCRKAFNAFKLLSVILLIPFYFLFVSSANVIDYIIWNVCFFAVFVVQIISLFVKRVDNK
jgi:hypothetical protein